MKEKILERTITGTLVGNFYDGRNFFEKIVGPGELEAKPGWMIRLDVEGPAAHLNISVKAFRMAQQFPQGTKFAFDELQRISSENVIVENMAVNLRPAQPGA